MDKIINEKRLRALAIKIGINDGHGWKSALQKKLLQKKPSIISTWIGRGVPKEFENILAMASIDVKIWREIIENVNNYDKSSQDDIPVDKEAGEKYKENLSEAISNHPVIEPNQSPTPLEKTAYILDTESKFCKALASNIDAFYEAMNMRRELNITKAKLAKCDNEIAAQKIILAEQAETHHQEIAELKNEIKFLKDELLAIKSA